MCLFILTIANRFLWLMNWVVRSGRMVWLRFWNMVGCRWVIWLWFWMMVWRWYMVNRGMVITRRMFVISVATWWSSKTGEAADWNDMFVWVFVMMVVMLRL